MNQKGSYTGSIKNSGSQFVQAPLGGADAKKGTVKHTGNDLRQGIKSSK